MITDISANQRYYSAAQVADILGLSKQSVIRYCTAGMYGAFKMHNRWFIPIDKFETYMQEVSSHLQPA